ncbi:MAG: signal recognition particle-docking protein FtsY [Nitrososphaeraceae archaeon]
MFDKLKKALSEVAKNLGQKELSERDLDRILEELFLSLLESDVAEQVAISIIDNIKSDLTQNRLEKSSGSEQIVKSRLLIMLSDLFSASGKMDLIEKVIEKKNSKLGPYVIVFLGINGTGKTTTVAKFSNLLHKQGLSVIMAAADTHRAGAIEQLSQHGTNLGIKIISQRYGADPSAVARDAVEHAKKNYIDTVLIDTAGRMQTSKNLMEEVSKIVRVIKPDAKIFVGDSLAGNDTVNQAKEFFQYTNFDGAILTKSDADSKGGAAISIVHVTTKPILYLGIGQQYDDLVKFDSEKFLVSVLGDIHSDHKVNTVQKQGEKTASVRDSAIEAIEENEQIPNDVSIEKIRTLTSKDTSACEAETGADLIEPIVGDANLQTDTLRKPNTISCDPKPEVQKPKNKGFFGGLLRRDRKENQDSLIPNKVGNQEQKDRPKKNERSGGNDEVVYLNDQDIDDLIE